MGAEAITIVYIGHNPHVLEIRQRMNVMFRMTKILNLVANRELLKTMPSEHDIDF